MRLLTCAAGDGRTATYSYREDVGQNKRDNMIASINIPGVTRFDYSYDANKNILSEIINNGSGNPGAPGSQWSFGNAGQASSIEVDD